ncbi:polysaccharide pyruvyl transferase family protein [Bifidobacterium pseudolongum]|uniref:polysaccharide pyruvyl transferase family protein n=1 Tax=Bifidobacterium pseudolongum TaxID=1694 RepID=UPI001F0CE18E|nr:polysaccharide pyruvyl transferase family protein [Bifidobacterium pseudolongum]MCH4853781.1 polysaccharide pyruvyl transferase family protein [Bifidobacterium pseudolongum]
MSKILVINQGQTDNIGDQAIESVLVNFLRGQGFEVAQAPYEERVEDRWSWSVDPKNIVPRIAMRIPRLMDHENRKRITNILGSVGRIDAAVIGGGELLASHWGFNSAFVSWVHALEETGIPVFVTGVSGDLIGGISSRRYGDALRTCEYVSVRDHATETQLRQICGLRVDYAPDVVFSYAKVHPTQDSASKRVQSMCVPVAYDTRRFRDLNLHDEDEYIGYLAKQFLVRKSGLPVTVTSTIMGDKAYPEHVAEALSARYGIEAHARTGVDLADFVQALRHTDYIVSARMHACILGLVYGCEINPIPYREKLAVFRNEYGTRESVEEVVEASYAGLLRLAEALSRRGV